MLIIIIDNAITSITICMCSRLFILFKMTLLEYAVLLPFKFRT